VPPEMVQGEANNTYEGYCYESLSLNIIKPLYLRKEMDISSQEI
jgi:hypothetical protein